jgi:hypothetical protein
MRCIGHSTDFAIPHKNHYIPLLYHCTFHTFSGYSPICPRWAYKKENDCPYKENANKKAWRQHDQQKEEKKQKEEECQKEDQDAEKHQMCGEEAGTDIEGMEVDGSREDDAGHLSTNGNCVVHREGSSTVEGGSCDQSDVNGDM